MYLTFLLSNVNVLIINIPDSIIEAKTVFKFFSIIQCLHISYVHAVIAVTTLEITQNINERFHIS